MVPSLYQNYSLIYKNKTKFFINLLIFNSFLELDRKEAQSLDEYYHPQHTRYSDTQNESPLSNMLGCCEANVISINDIILWLDINTPEETLDANRVLST